MGRFRSNKTFKLVAHLRGERVAPMPAWKREEEGLSRELHDRWNTLHRHCADQSSHLRLGRLAGVVTARLTRIPTISAVVMSIWDVDPLPSRGAVRLANVEAVERAKHQSTQPRVRMFVLNPIASAPLSESHDALIRQTL